MHTRISTSVGWVLLLACAAMAADSPKDPPAELVEKLEAEPAGDFDRDLKMLILDYETSVAKLDAADAHVRYALPRIRDNLAVLYREYNTPNRKRRYRRDHFTPAECLKWLKADMAIQLEKIALGKEDPLKLSSGRWHAKVAWLEGIKIMARYDLQAPKDYDPTRSWPVIISYQSNPVREKTSELGYFQIKSIQRGYPKGLVAVRNKTAEFLKDACREFSIDPVRVYATGFSYGGNTSLTMAYQHPHWFAAIAPVCNDLRSARAVNVKWLGNVPTLLLHGDRDSFLRTGKIIHKYMVEAGCTVEFGTYPGGHSASGVFREDVKRLTDFFAKHTMDPYPKTVHHVVTHKRYSRAFWVNGKLIKDSGKLAGTFTVAVKDGNRIEVEANEHIQSLTFFLSGKLVDMSKPITVVAGEKVLYQGESQAELTVKLRDGVNFFQRPGDTLWADMLEIREAAVYALPKK